MRILNLEGNKLRAKSLDHILEEISSSGSLHVVNLSNN